MSRSMASSGRGRDGRGRRGALRSVPVGHLFVRHAPPPPLRGRPALHLRLWRTVCPQAEATCSQNVPTTEQSVGEATVTAPIAPPRSRYPRGGARHDGPGAAGRVPADPAARLAAAHRPRAAAARPGAVPRARHRRRRAARPRSCCAGCTPQLVRGRRYNAQATALTRQGRLAVYPSSTGQEACEIAAALALRGARLALPELPRHPRRRRPRPRPRPGADPAARRLAHRLRPARAPRRPAVHPARHPAAARRGPRARRPPQGRRRGGARHGRRRRHQRGRLPRGAELRGRLAGAGGLPRPEQRLRDLRAARQADRRPVPRPQGGRLRHAGPAGRRQRRGGRARGARPRPCAARARAAARPWSRPSPTASRPTPTPTTPPATAATPRSRPGARTTRSPCWSAS